MTLVKLIPCAGDASDWDRVLHACLAAALLALGVAGRVGDAHHDRVVRQHRRGLAVLLLLLLLTVLGAELVQHDAD